MLVGDQVEVVRPAPPPLPRALHLVLELDDVLAEDEAGVEELLEDADGEGDVVLVAAVCISPALAINADQTDSDDPKAVAAVLGLVCTPSRRQLERQCVAPSRLGSRPGFGGLGASRLRSRHHVGPVHRHNRHTCAFPAQLGSLTGSQGSVCSDALSRKSCWPTPCLRFLHRGSCRFRCAGPRRHREMGDAPHQPSRAYARGEQPPEDGSVFGQETCPLGSVGCQRQGGLTAPHHLLREDAVRKEDMVAVAAGVAGAIR